jgi:hypothetical protein
LEDGKNLVPDSGAKKARVEIGRVFAVRNGVPRNVRVDVGAACIEHRSDSIAGAGGQDREPLGAGAAHQPHDEGFGAVVRMVARGDAVSSRPSGGDSQGIPADCARSRLQVAAGLELYTRALEGHVE